MLTVAEAADRLGRNPETVRRWIRSGRLPARRVGARHAIDDRDLRVIEDELHPMSELPEEWRVGDDGTLALNWVAAPQTTESTKPEAHHGLRQTQGGSALQFARRQVRWT
jgi:excisionase family DNA binding protein